MTAGTSGQMEREIQFLQNWISDLLAALESEIDYPTRVKVFQKCGRGCFYRFDFKQQIALQGNGSVNALLNAYRQHFEAWQDADGIHIRYGETSERCYCPAARHRPYSPRDLHCECTRATHQMIFETALSSPVEIDIIETLRRGGKTCHFVARVSRRVDF